MNKKYIDANERAYEYSSVTRKPAPWPKRNKLKEEVGVLAVQVKISYFIDYKQPVSH